MTIKSKMTIVEKARVDKKSKELHATGKWQEVD